LKAKGKHPSLCLNMDYDLMSKCRHRPKFHRFRWSN
jgi:hypothetical protein